METKAMRWRVISSGSLPWKKGNLEKHLKDGWEPFAVTKNSMGEYTVWLRKQVEV